MEAISWPAATANGPKRSAQRGPGRAVGEGREAGCWNALVMLGPPCPPLVATWSGQSWGKIRGILEGYSKKYFFVAIATTAQLYSTANET